MKPRTSSRLAWSVWTVSVVALLTPFVYRLSGHRVQGFSDTPGSVYPGIGVVLFVLAFATVGAILASKRPSNPIGWLLLAAGLCDATGTFSIFLGRFSEVWADWLGNWVWGLGVAIPATFVLLLFPTGHLPSRRWRPVAWFAGAAVALTTMGNAFAPGVMPDSHSVNPVGIGGPLGPLFSALQGLFVFILLAGLACLASLVFRYRRADRVEREQLRWLVFAGGLLLAAVVAGSIVTAVLGTSDFTTNIQNAIVAASFVFVPLAIGFAVLKYRLYDIDLVINKTVVYALLAAFITAVYIAIVVGIGALIGRGTSKESLPLSILATAVVAVAFQPVRDRVQRLANRLVYGKRATPYEVLSEFSSRMAGAYAGEDLLPRMARILAEGTGAKVAEVWLRVGGGLRLEATWPGSDATGAVASMDGERLPSFPAASLTLPVHHGGEVLGALTVTKPPGERLTPGEEHLARDLASGAGLVLRNVRLTEELLARLEELRASRQRLVAAQDQERRRLERNIHDGAQQQLVALAVKLRLARGLAERDPDKASTMLADVESEITSALEDLRDLARGIYPPLLADQGLVAALRAQARKAPFPVTVEADGIGRHTQDVEAAVYFCALEALQNVAKYAGASTAVLRLRDSESLVSFEVEDDGAGFDPAVTSYGTGLQGMADRLSALGGEVHVRSAPGHGTTIGGWLPVLTVRSPELAEVSG